MPSKQEGRLPPSWRNENRRKKYREDVQHRESVRERYREKYREEKGVEPNGVDIKAKIHHLSEYGTRREGRVTFTVIELAAVIGRASEVFRQWIDRGCIPSPVMVKGGQHVYTLKEAKAIAVVLADHFSLMLILRTDHRHTINRIWNSVREIRGE